MKKSVKVLLSLFVFISTAGLAIKIPSVVNAVPIINEVYPKPNIDEKEWIEIFNDSEESVNLSGWILMDELASSSVIYEFDQEASNLLIEPLSFLVIELPTSKLNNSADTVKLIDSDSKIINQLEYSNSELGMSFSLIKNSEGDLEITLSTPTKNEANYISNDDPDDDAPEENYPNLIISEIMACPESNDSEWIKIKNPNDEPVNLSNWQAKDAANNQIVLPEAETIIGLEFTTIYLTNNILNNSGDTISLLDPSNKLVDQFQYTECTIGVSLTTDDLLENLPDENEDEQDESEDINNSQKENGINEKTSIVNEIPTLKKINSLLKIANTDKSSSMKTDEYISKQVIIKHKSLPKSAIISAIIGGMILSSSGLLFINEKN